MRELLTFTRLLYLLTLSIVTTAEFSNALAQSNGGLPPVSRSTTTSAQKENNESSAPSKPSSYKSIPQKFDVIGQQISFTNPIGYCTPGESSREKELLASARQMLPSSARLVLASVKCDELDSYRTGRRETLDHWLQIQLIGPKGEFKRLETSREAFLSGLAKSTTKLDTADLKKNINSKLKDFDIDMSNVKVHQIGRDGNAYYMTTRSTLQYGEKSKVVTGLGGVTLINALPLGIWIYESTGAAQSRDQLHIVLQQALVSLTTEN